MPSAQQTLIAVPLAVIATAAATWAIEPAATLTAAPPGELSGWVDLHTHPMVNLAFSGKLVYGGVDVGSLMPAGRALQSQRARVELAGGAQR